MQYVQRKRRVKKLYKWLISLVIVLFLVGVTFLSQSFIVEQINRFRTQFIQEPELTEIIITEPPIKILTQTERLVLGARKDALAMPAYVNAYYAGGYPPDDEGTCTDLIWRAFMEAGFNLKDAIDADIRQNRSAYPNITIRDPNIDFRRVQNLKVFFERHAIKLTNDVYQTDQWQAGDIVIFGRNDHIGIVSDIRNANDIPYLIHNNDQPLREEDRLEYGSYTMGITGHYRFIFPTE
jgi:uncharacterized protein